MPRPAPRLRMPKTVDRSIAKAVAFKRAFTGVTSVLAGGAMVVVAVSREEKAWSLPIVASLVFLFVGAWALRDGVRLFRALGR